MIAFGWLLLMWWLRLDSEQFVGDQEFLYKQDQQDQLDQGKYSMGSSLFPNNFNHTIHIACVFLLSIY